MQVAAGGATAAALASAATAANEDLTANDNMQLSSTINEQAQEEYSDEELIAMGSYSISSRRLRSAVKVAQITAK